MKEKLNLEMLLNHTAISLEEFAEEVSISVDELRAYAEGKKQLKSEECIRITEFTELAPSKFLISEDKGTTVTNAIKAVDVFGKFADVKQNLLEYIEETLQKFDDAEIHTELEEMGTLVKTLKKPKIAFSGYSDVGKSTLINALLGTDKLPAKWTPTTSIVVHIKHTDDRPEFMHEDVWIFKKDGSERWDDTKLDDETYCRKFLIKNGDYPLLQEFGTHQGKKGEIQGLQKADSAVVFIDSPLLKNCDILDVPGFGANKEDDEKQKSQMMRNVDAKNVGGQIDILIYLSRANGFMTDNDMNYLKQAISRLRPIEQLATKDVPIPPLANLFILASQAGAVNSGNATELERILDTKCKTLCQMYSIASEDGSSLLPSRTAITKHNYTEADFRARFFTYETEQPRLCREFNKDLQKLSECLPKVIYADFKGKFKKKVGFSTEHLTAVMRQYMEILQERQMYQLELRKMRAGEEERKREQDRRKEEIITLIEFLCSKSKTEIQKSCSEILNVEYLMNLMETKEIQNNKKDKNSFSTGINELLNNKISEILQKNSERYAQAMEDYLKQYQEALFSSEKVSVEFNVEHAFAMGMAGLVAVGAGGAWLAFSLDAMMFAVFGFEAGAFAVAAVLGAVGIVIGGIVLGVIAIFQASKWREKFAQSIIQSYEKNNFLNSVFESVDKYWKDTKISFRKGVNNLEREVEKKMLSLEQYSEESNIPELQKKISTIQSALEFFQKMPLEDETP